MSDRPYLLERVDEAASSSSTPTASRRCRSGRRSSSGTSTTRRSPAATSSTTSATRTTSRCGRCSRRSSRTPARWTPATLAEITRYTKLFWLNTGPFNNLTARKFVLQCAPEAFRAAARRRPRHGARFPLRRRRNARRPARPTRAARSSTSSFEPICTSKTPGPGRDILEASANNLLPGRDDGRPGGVRGTLPAQLAARARRRPAGRGGVSDRRPVRQGDRRDRRRTSRRRCHSRTPPQARALAALVRFYRTGETADREAYDIAWVSDRESPVDTINGFIEVYLDARGMKGAWEALVFYVNPEKTRAIRTLAREAQWFEDRMPWDPVYRKQGVPRRHGQRRRRGGRDRARRPGDAGRHQPAERPAGPRAARQQVGLALERHRGVREVDAARLPRASSRGPPEEAARAEQWAAFAGELHTNMHEVIGHGSGRGRGAAGRQPAGVPAGALLGARGGARRPGRALLPRRSRRWSSWAWCGRRPRGRRAGRRTRSYSRNALVQLAASARGARSRKTTCATAS